MPGLGGWTLSRGGWAGEVGEIGARFVFSGRFSLLTVCLVSHSNQESKESAEKSRQLSSVSRRHASAAMPLLSWSLDLSSLCTWCAQLVGVSIAGAIGWS